MILLKICEPSLNLDKFLFVCLQQRRNYTVSNTDKLWRTTALIYVDNRQYYTVSVIRSRELGQDPILVFLTPRQALSSHPCQVLNRINIDFILISRHSKFFYCFWRRWDWDTSCFRSHMHVSKT